MPNRILTTFLVLIAPVLSAQLAAAADETRTERVRFEPGASSAVVEDSITGYESVDYVLRAGRGQYANVSMATDNGANYFNILAPGEDAVAMFIGSNSGNQYEGVLPASGDYKIRVYLMRSAARRDETANYRLEMVVTGDTVRADAGGPAGDALVPGTDFHATGRIPCAMAAGQPAGSCLFGVRREGDGSGTVVVTRPDGRIRAIFFEHGHAVGADTSQADPGEFSARKEADLSYVRIGDERYEIPDAVIFGG